MSSSWAEGLVRLHRGLERCPLLARAFDNGDLTQQQAELVLRIVDRNIEKPWIEHTRSTTVCFLKQDIENALRLRALQPELFAQTMGLPQGRPAASLDARTRKPTDPRALDQYVQRCDVARERVGLPALKDMVAEPQNDRGDRPETNPMADTRIDENASSTAETCHDESAASAAETRQDESASTGGDSQVDDDASTEPDSRLDEDPSHPQMCALPSPSGESFQQMLVNVLEEMDGVGDHYATDTFAGRYRFWLPAAVEENWSLVYAAACELMQGPASVEDCMGFVLEAVIRYYGPQALEIIRKHPLIERDGWRCSVPTCGRRAPLHEHHLCFRSQGGGDEPYNRIALCEFHHLRGVHRAGSA